MYWKEIETIGTEKSKYNPGIGTNYQFYKFKFLSPKTGFLVGNYNNQIDIDIDNVTWNTIRLNEDAIALRTIDGGYHWQEAILGKGEIIDFNNVDNTLLCLRWSYHGKEADETTSHLHISRDQGENWQEISTNKIDQIDEIHFWTPNKGIGICGLKGYRYDKLKMLFTEDTGKTWKEIQLPKSYKGMDFAVTSKGILYYLTKEQTSYLVVDLNTLRSQEISFTNLEALPYSVVLDNQENVYFVVENEDKRNILYKKIDENKYDKIEFPFKDEMINDVYIYDNVISIIVDKSGDTYFRSEDYGKTWKSESYSKTYISNITFYGKDNIWIRTIPGKMLVRK